MQLYQIESVEKAQKIKSLLCSMNDSDLGKLIRPHLPSIFEAWTPDVAVLKSFQSDTKWRVLVGDLWSVVFTFLSSRSLCYIVRRVNSYWHKLSCMDASWSCSSLKPIATCFFGIIAVYSLTEQNLTYLRVLCLHEIVGEEYDERLTDELLKGLPWCKRLHTIKCSSGTLLPLSLFKNIPSLTNLHHRLFILDPHEADFQFKNLLKLNIRGYVHSLAKFRHNFHIFKRVERLNAAYTRLSLHQLQEIATWPYLEYLDIQISDRLPFEAFNSDTSTFKSLKTLISNSTQFTTTKELEWICKNMPHLEEARIFITDAAFPQLRGFTAANSVRIQQEHLDWFATHLPSLKGLALLCRDQQTPENDVILVQQLRKLKHLERVTWYGRDFDGLHANLQLFAQSFPHIEHFIHNPGVLLEASDWRFQALKEEDNYFKII